MAELHSVSALAEILGMDRRTVTKRLDDLSPDQEEKTGRGLDRRWELGRVIQHLTTPSACESLNLEAERARLAKEQADKTALDNATRRGELLEVNLVERAWLAILVSMRARLLALPTKMAPELATITDANRIRDRLTTEVHTILAEAAAYRATSADFDGDGPGVEDQPGAAAAAETDGQPVGRRKPKTKPGKQRRAGRVAH